MSQIRVLIVCNDARFLKELRVDYGLLFKQWDMRYVPDGRQALQALTKEPCEVVMVDRTLPDVDGMELLRTLATRFPQIIRLAYVDPRDSQGMARATSLAHQFLLKPYTPELLRVAIYNSVGVRMLLTGENMRQLVAKITVLPSLPNLYLQVNQELQSPNSSMAKIGEIIARDLAMSARVVKVVNSAYFGMPQRVQSPAQAVTLLGADTIKSLILAYDVFAQFDQLARRVPEFALDGLQAHSMATASLARLFARHEELQPGQVDAIFLAGLFHDLGKLVLIANLPQQYNQVLATMRAKNVSCSTAEWAVFGVTHAEVGAYLLGLWGFPDDVIEACAYHHQPDKYEQLRVFTPVTAVHVANVFAHELPFPRRNPSGSKLDLNYLRSTEQNLHLAKWHSLFEQAAQQGALTLT